MSEYEWKPYTAGGVVRLGAADHPMAHFWEVAIALSLDEMDLGSGISALSRGDSYVAPKDQPEFVPYERTKWHFKTCAICWEREAERLTKKHREAVLMRVIDR